MTCPGERINTAIQRRYRWMLWMRGESHASGFSRGNVGSRASSSTQSVESCQSRALALRTAPSLASADDIARMDGWIISTVDKPVSHFFELFYKRFFADS